MHSELSLSWTCWTVHKNEDTHTHTHKHKHTHTTSIQQKIITTANEITITFNLFALCLQVHAPVHMHTARALIGNMTSQWQILIWFNCLDKPSVCLLTQAITSIKKPCYICTSPEHVVHIITRWSDHQASKKTENKKPPKTSSTYNYHYYRGTESRMNVLAC